MTKLTSIAIGLRCCGGDDWFATAYTHALVNLGVQRALTFVSVR